KTNYIGYDEKSGNPLSHKGIWSGGLRRPRSFRNHELRGFVFTTMIMQCRDTSEACYRVGLVELWQELVLFNVNRYSILALESSNAHDLASAADWHALGQRNLRRHNQGKLNCLSFAGLEVRI